VVSEVIEHVELVLKVRSCLLHGRELGGQLAFASGESCEFTVYSLSLGSSGGLHAP
jgi:hypothetical protein